MSGAGDRRGIHGRGLWPVDVLRSKLRDLDTMLQSMALDYPLSGAAVLADLRGRRSVIEYALRCHGASDDMARPLRVFLGEVLVDTAEQARSVRRGLNRDQRAKRCAFCRYRDGVWVDCVNGNCRSGVKL
jgi:hypothetical protein